MKKSFYSHGKLLITGEYLVLDGVKALAIPTKKGQWMTVEEQDSDQIHWKSFDTNGKLWFETSFRIDEKELRYIEGDIETVPVAKTLLEILNVAKELNSNFISGNKGFVIETRLEFPQNWGLGSSSTLINNLAQWALVNPFELLEKSFGGSGYDIACAQRDTPLLYKRNNSTPMIKEVPFSPFFKEQLFFVHLNQKQDSKAAIKHYYSLPLKSFDEAEIAINRITEELLECKNIERFEELLTSHEEIISSIIKTETVKSRLFSDYPRAIKSLGGWGGDFVLATGTPDQMNYFRNKGFETMISFNDMIFEK